MDTQKEKLCINTMELKINLHSDVDVITNSSTEIYISTHSNSIKRVKEFIDKILKVAKSNKSADELFTFELDYDGVDGEYEDYLDEVKSDPEDFDEDEPYSREIWIEREEENGRNFENTLIIKSKDVTDKVSIDLVNEIYGMLSINASNDY